MPSADVCLKTRLGNLSEYLHTDKAVCLLLERSSVCQAGITLTGSELLIQETQSSRVLLISHTAHRTQATTFARMQG